MPQGRSVEALQHDAEAPVQRHLAEHLRHRDAGGAHGADHAYLVPAEQMRDAGLEQLHDLTGRPGVGFGEGAFTDLFPQRSLHARSPPCRGNTGGEQKGTPPVAGAGNYDRLQPAETFVHPAKWSQVRFNPEPTQAVFFSLRTQINSPNTIIPPAASLSILR